MPRILTYYCPDPICRARMVKRSRGPRGAHYICPECKATIPIPEREKLLALGCSELPGFETEGS